MQIKRFEAKNMTIALRMIKEELGPDAVILSARSLRKGKGFFGSMKYSGVEVSAAVDNRLPFIRGADPGGRKNIFSNLNSARAINANQVEKKESTPTTDYPVQSRTYQQRYSRRNDTGSKDHNRALTSLYQQILAQEVDRGIASELIEEVKRIPASQELLQNGELRSHLASILEEMGVVVDKDALNSKKSNIVAFIGTTGVGKTTTIAKLAASQTKRYRKRVALITLDNYGISAMEQIKTYAQIIGIPLAVAVNIADLKRAVKKFKDKELILIDTPGISPKNQNQIKELKTYFTKVSDLQTHLVLSATTKEKDVIAITEAFKEVGVHRLLFTKIDESSASGNIVNVLIRTKIPLSFLCGGRKVPDDIEAGSIRRLVELLFQSKSAVSAQPIESSNSTAVNKASGDDQTYNRTYFVANKNSDVYHCPDCKWSKKIKFDNIIKFSSTQEADAQNFLPCRSCNPDRIQSRNRFESNIEKKKFTNYQ